MMSGMFPLRSLFNMIQWDLSLRVFAYFLGPPCVISPGNLLPGYDSESPAEKTSTK